MLSSRYKALAERRYREFLWQERWQIWNDKLISLSMHLLTGGVVVMQQVGVIRRQTIEKVRVE